MCIYVTLATCDIKVNASLPGSLYSLTNAFNPFHATGLFLYPLTTSENQDFYIFRGYRKRPVAWNGLRNALLAETTSDSISLLPSLPASCKLLFVLRIYKTNGCVKKSLCEKCLYSEFFSVYSKPYKHFYF